MLNNGLNSHNDEENQASSSTHENKRKRDETNSSLKKQRTSYEGTEQYFINTKKHYKIWFSNDRTQFLPQENQLRLIRMRYKNPDSTIALVYSSNVLCKEACSDLNSFCNRHNIKPVDIDNDLSGYEWGKRDLELYHMAKSEIERSVNNTGGNLAAASDIVRMMNCIVENFGIYSDFDVDVNFSSLPEKYNVKAPLVLPASKILTPIANLTSIENPTVNNEFLAFSYDPATGRMSKKAQHLIHDIQDEIIRRFNNPLQYLLYNSLLVEELQPIFIEIPFYKKMLLDFFEKNPHSKAADFREKINKLTSEDKLNLTHSHDFNFFNLFFPQSNRIELFLHNIYIETVTNTTGPCALFVPIFRSSIGVDVCELAKKILPKIFISLFFGMPYEWKKAMDQLVDHGLEANGLEKLIQSKNSLVFIEECEKELRKAKTIEDMKENIGKCGDQSWTPIGKGNMQKREDKMQQAARKIQNAFRNFRSHRKTNLNLEDPLAASASSSSSGRFTPNP